MAGKSSQKDNNKEPEPGLPRAREANYFGTGWSAPPRWRQDEEAQTALKHLGPLPFPKGPVPLMGILASLYYHVSTSAREYLAGSVALPWDHG